MIQLKKCFSKHHNKTKFKNLECLVVIFQAWENLCGLNNLNNLQCLNDLENLILQKKLSFMFPSTMTPKWPILVSQRAMDYQKPTNLLIICILSLGGCEGHPLRPNLNEKGQMAKPNE
jgi:hypothetical protein